MFAGLTDGDFEAYAPKKWKSNVYNRERLEVRQKLQALGRLLLAGPPDLHPANLESLSQLSMDSSVEHPALSNHKQVDAQHLYFSRSEAERRELDRIIERGQPMSLRLDDPTPQHNHLFLALTVSSEQFAIGLHLHRDARVDRENLERKCEDHFELGKIVALFRDLPAGFLVGLSVTAEEPATLASAIDGPRLRELLSALGGELATPGPPPGPGPRHAAPGRLLQLASPVTRAAAVAAGPRLADITARAIGHLLPIYRFIAWARDNDFVSMREALRLEKQAHRQRGLQPRDEVRIVRGLLAGQLGVVQEIDARGGVRLLVGKVAIKLDAANLEKS